MKEAKFMETADVARELGLVPASVRAAVNAGKLKVAARTERGTRLFQRADFEVFKRERGGNRRASGRVS